MALATQVFNAKPMKKLAERCDHFHNCGPVCLLLSDQHVFSDQAAIWCTRTEKWHAENRPIGIFLYYQQVVIFFTRLAGIFAPLLGKPKICER